jgi:hypothetical protein
VDSDSPGLNEFHVILSQVVEDAEKHDQDATYPSDALEEELNVNKQ